MEEPGFNCGHYGQFKSSPMGKGSFFTVTLEDRGFEIPETQLIGERRLVLKVETFEKTLTEFIEEEEPKKASEYGSSILYPTQQAKSVIHALVKEVRKLKKYEKVHGFLHNTDNILLHHQEDDPSHTIKVSIIHTKQGSHMDDDEALENLIFKQILGYDLHDYENGRIPPEWAHFWDLCYAKNPNYDQIVNHSCLWSDTKKLDYYPVLFGWLRDPLTNKQEFTSFLDGMEVFESNWISMIDRY